MCVPLNAKRTWVFCIPPVKMQSKTPSMQGYIQPNQSFLHAHAITSSVFVNPSYLLVACHRVPSANVVYAVLPEHKNIHTSKGRKARKGREEWYA